MDMILEVLDYYSGLQFSPKNKNIAINGQVYSINIVRSEEDCQNSEFFEKMCTRIIVCKEGKNLIFEKNVARGIESFDEYFIREEIADGKMVCSHIHSTGEVDGPYCVVENKEQLDVRIYQTGEDDFFYISLDGNDFYRQNSVLTGYVKGKNYLLDDRKKVFIENEEYDEMMEISSTVGGKEEITQGLHLLHLADQYLNTNMDCWTHYSEEELVKLEQQIVSMAGDIYAEHITQLDTTEASKQNIKK